MKAGNKLVTTNYLSIGPPEGELGRENAIKPNAVAPVFGVANLDIELF